MATLAIKGHPKRGNEVIEILEMLGGRNLSLLLGDSALYYAINREGIISTHCEEQVIKFSLEEFLEKFPYKVGYKVSSKYLKNYKIVKMEWSKINNRVIYKLQGMGWYSVDELQPYKEETMGDRPDLLQQLKEYFENTPREVVEKEWHEYDKYNEIGPSVEEYLEYVSNIRQPQYPKTYEECCNVLGIEDRENGYCGYEWELLGVFQKLYICRDAYWKIAGEQMGLGKSWEPDFGNDLLKYYISFHNNKIDKGVINYSNKILAFPTEEMRDAFYENFNELIVNCKELL